MVKLHVDLQDGFEDDEVIVTINGDKLFHEKGITTAMLLGLADSFETTLDVGEYLADVRVPTRNLRASVPLALSQDIYLGIRIENGAIRNQILLEPFGYA